MAKIKYRVTIKIAGKPDWTTTVEATDCSPTTAAMAKYPHRLRGELVTFSTEKL